MPTVGSKTRYGATQIAEKYRQDAQQILDHYGTEELVLVFLEVGGIFPAVDLARAIERINPNFPLTLYPLYASRYGDAMAGKEAVQIIETRPIPTQTHLLLVDDIIDRGDTLQACVDYLNIKKPRSVRCYCHTIRDGCRVPANVHLVCRPLPLPEGEWGVGHGMSDENGYHRGSAEITTLTI